ncbi:uncharacterized protein BDR25DRAFT_283415 [Lindgomyces ingoldianus]|uniref:Uncharacterized protein n=1 Tax=Lindgomyces ingoldianus TaxID=673940 RepID=A0ACB6R199_9PLEO|nr:uncharacterized protein BDR25DRAFT_283415 [Lindgomyces ingoldianus]KAF2472860.1 hypothetical protein BDR25DRAFT_283415 [Lindgomyces ingoldianus]
MSSSLPKPSDSTFTPYPYDTSLADLGQIRYDQDVAAIGDRDHAFFTQAPVHVASGRAPEGLEAQVFAWNLMQHTTEDRDDREELKGDLHGGQLHRANRAALQPVPNMSLLEPVGGRGRANLSPFDPLVAAYKPENSCPPLAKGHAAELPAELFWNEPIPCDL